MNITFKNTDGQRIAVDPDKLVIYGNGVKLFERETDLDAYDMHPNKTGEMQLFSRYHAGPIGIVLHGDVKNARKENLNRTDNFTLSYTPDYLKWEKRQALYIHVSEIGVDDLGDVLSMETEEEKNYLHAVRLHFNGATTYQRYHVEKIPVAKDWRLPDGARWSDCYGTEDKPCFDTPSRYTVSKHPELEGCVIKRWCTVETLGPGAEMIAVERYYTKTIESDDRKRKRAIAEKLNASGQYNADRDRWSHYDITRLENALGYKLRLEV